MFRLYLDATEWIFFTSIGYFSRLFVLLAIICNIRTIRYSGLPDTPSRPDSYPVTSEVIWLERIALHCGKAGRKAGPSQPAPQPSP